MAEYHVGCGITGIFAGTINKKGTMWVNKSDVTYEAMSAVAQFLLKHEATMKFNYQGKRYRLAVEPQESEDNNVVPVSVLQDIKAEIAQVCADSIYYPNWEYAKGLQKAIEIIDKYKADRSEEDGNDD